MVLCDGKKSCVRVDFGNYKYGSLWQVLKYSMEDTEDLKEFPNGGSISPFVLLETVRIINNSKYEILRPQQKLGEQNCRSGINLLGFLITDGKVDGTGFFGRHLLRHSPEHTPGLKQKLKA